VNADRILPGELIDRGAPTVFSGSPVSLGPAVGAVSPFSVNDRVDEFSKAAPAILFDSSFGTRTTLSPRTPVTFEALGAHSTGSVTGGKSLRLG
jgi:hypothetical protein